MSAVRLVVHGRVQGVGFRYALQSEAEEAGATGWVTNRADGTVEVHAGGDEDAIERVISFAGRGPRGAQVERVERDDVEPEGSTDFGIR